VEDQSVPGGARHPRSAAFLLAQIGAHAAARFAERLSQVDLVAAQAGILRVVASRPGISQQELSSLLGMLPSRLVPFLDQLEQRGLVERRDNPADRRLYALHLTEKGAKTGAAIRRIARDHDDEVCAALDTAQREQLHVLLCRIADEQGLTPGVHPGFSKVTARPVSDSPRRAKRATRR
jgi:DNA-binding MarR family transcriptional regulator